MRETFCAWQPAAAPSLPLPGLQLAAMAVEAALAASLAVEAKAAARMRAIAEMAEVI